MHLRSPVRYTQLNWCFLSPLFDVLILLVVMLMMFGLYDYGLNCFSLLSLEISSTPSIISFIYPYSPQGFRHHPVLGVFSDDRRPIKGGSCPIYIYRIEGALTDAIPHIVTAICAGLTASLHRSATYYPVTIRQELFKLFRITYATSNSVANDTVIRDHQRVHGVEHMNAGMFTSSTKSSEFNASVSWLITSIQSW